MSEIITRPIGTRFKCDGVELEVVENTHDFAGYCGGYEDPCYFGGDCAKCNDSNLECRGKCSDMTRTDGKDVYFRRVQP